MPKYRKKPVTIEAFQITGAHMDDMTTWPDWLRRAWLKDPDEQGAFYGGLYSDGTYCFIQTLEGQMKARPGDWIIQGVSGELYPCRDEIFVQTYEPVEEA